MRKQTRRVRRIPARAFQTGHPYGGTEPNRDSPKPEVPVRTDELEEQQRQHPDDYRSPK